MLQPIRRISHTSALQIFIAALTALTLTSCTAPIDYHTQSVDAGGATCLNGKQLYFARSPRYDAQEPQLVLDFGYYDRFVRDQTELPVGTEGHEAVDFSMADPFRVPLPQGASIPYYGFPANMLYIGSDGTIGMGPGEPNNATLRDHFNVRQISLLPVDATVAGATVSYSITSAEIVVTFDDVDGNTVQCQLFLSGEAQSEIAITYASVNANTLAGVVGLSNGQELPFGRTEIQETDFVGDRFVESDLCVDSPPRIWLAPPAD